MEGTHGDGTELIPSGVTVNPHTERFIQTERSISSKAEVLTVLYGSGRVNT